MSKTKKLDPLTVLAIHRLAAQNPADTAKAYTIPGEHHVEATISLSGTVSVGEAYESDNVPVSWMDVSAFLLSQFSGRERDALLKRLNRQMAKEFEGNDDLEKNKATLRRKAVSLYGQRVNSGKLTGKVTARSI